MAARPASKNVAAPKRQPYWLTQEQMAAACGVSVKSFQQWRIEPVAKIGRCTFYVVKDVLANRLANQLQRLVTDSARSTPESEVELARQEREEKLLLTREQRIGQELKNQQLRKELAPVQVIEWVVGKVGGQISAILESIPMQMKKRNPKLTATDIEVAKREIVKAQNVAAGITVDLNEYYERDGEGDR